MLVFPQGKLTFYSLIIDQKLAALKLIGLLKSQRALQGKSECLN